MLNVLKELQLTATVWYCHNWPKICCLLQHGGLWGEKGNMWDHLLEIPPVYFQLPLLGKFPSWHYWSCWKDLIAKVLLLVWSASQAHVCFGQSFSNMQACIKPFIRLLVWPSFLLVIIHFTRQDNCWDLGTQRGWKEIRLIDVPRSQQLLWELNFITKDHWNDGQNQVKPKW